MPGTTRERQVWYFELTSGFKILMLSSDNRECLTMS